MPVGTRSVAKNPRQLNQILSAKGGNIFTTCRLEFYTSVKNILLKVVWENKNDHGPKSFPKYLKH